jgi:hypothetical protein
MNWTLKIRENKYEVYSQSHLSKIGDTSKASSKLISKTQILLEGINTVNGRKLLRPESSQPKRINHGQTSMEPSRNTGFKGLNQPCQLICSCSCHIPVRYRLPTFFTQVMGTALIEYSASASSRQPCNEQSCRKQSSSSTRIIYHFPEWCLVWCVLTPISLKHKNGPELLLRTVRTRDYRDEVFYLAYDGDLDGIKTLIAEGEASPHDMTNTTNTSLLQVSVHSSLPISSCYDEMTC